MDTQLNLFLDNEKISSKKCFNPHKYILLLSIAYLYDMNAYRENKFYLDELIDVFNQILEEFFEKNSYPKNATEYTFFYLINNKFWFLKINYGKEDAYNEVIKKYNSRFTLNRIREIIEYAYLSENIHHHLRDKIFRDNLIEKKKKLYITFVKKIHKKGVLC